MFPLQKFETFYSSQYNGRKLTWMHHLCTIEVKVNYLKKPYIITMGTLQMAFLMPFNQSDVLSFADLLAATTVRDLKGLWGPDLNGPWEASMMTWKPCRGPRRLA